jgi:tetratricopeptide (TPR) repeat protein
MWHDADDRLSKAVERFEEGAVEAARLMLRNLDRRGVVSPRIDLYLGHCHLEAESFRAAIRRYRRCISLSPDSPAPWIGLGLCYGRLGLLERAVEAFEEALRRGPGIEEIHCNLTHCHALAGDLRRAEEHAREAVALDPRCPHVHRHLALAYLLAGQPERSLAAWRRVRALMPEHPELPVGVGRAYARLGRRDEARRQYVEALEGPFAADARFGLGDLARDVEELREAAGHYARALEADPSFGEARQRQAECLAELGRYDEAWKILAPLLAGGEPAGAEVVAAAATILHGCGQRRRALRLLRDLVRDDPQAAGRWRALGRHLLDTGRPRAAVAVLRRAGRADPADVDAPRLLARALGRSGQARRAVALLARAAHRCPGEEDLHVDVAAALVARGREAAAERALLRGLSWNPESATLWAAVAELALDGGRLPLARARLRSALRRDRRHPHALALLVRWLRAAGRPAKAARAGRAALRVVPAGDPVVREHASALLESGRPEEALLHLRRYVLAAPGDPRGYAALADALDLLGDEPGARTQRALGELVAV